MCADPQSGGQHCSTSAGEIPTFQTKARTLLEPGAGAGLVPAPRQRIVELSAGIGRHVDVVRLKDAQGEPSFLAD